MRTPLRAKGGVRTQVSTSSSIPAPLFGLNARDSVADMKPGYALVLENWFPRTSYLEVRGGCADHVTALPNTVKTLAVYNKTTGTSEMYATTSTGVYNVTNAGVVGASVASRTNGKHITLNYGDGTNNYLMMFNGVDKPLYYEGTTWTAVDSGTSPALSGLASTSIPYAFSSKGRLYFLENNSLSFWYLAAGAAGGALTEYPLDGICKKGGYLMAGSTWTFDGGEGVDDAVVLISSEGEIVVFKGTNPSSPTTWLMVGVFDIGRPLGRNCITKQAGDLLIITESGVFPISQALQSASVDKRAAITNIIENAITQVASSYGSNYGWQITSLPSQSALILNVPIVEDGDHIQYVMNTITKAWCKFDGWDAETFCEFNGELYYSTGLKIVKSWTGNADFGNDIVAYGKTAFAYFGTQGKQKKFTLFRPILNVNGSLSFLTGIDVDYKDSSISDEATYTVTNGALWDVGMWDESYWAAGMEIIRRWTSPSQDVGYCASCKIKVNTNSLTVQWIANDIVYESGGVL